MVVLSLSLEGKLCGDRDVYSLAPRLAHKGESHECVRERAGRHMGLGQLTHLFDFQLDFLLSGT